PRSSCARRGGCCTRPRGRPTAVRTAGTSRRRRRSTPPRSPAGWWTGRSRSTAAPAWRRRTRSNAGTASCGSSASAKDRPKCTAWSSPATCSAAASRSRGGFVGAALEDVLVLDLGQIYNGPYCSMLLAYQGAKGIKIEPPIGEVLRRRKRSAADQERHEFLMLNSNKSGITLDLKREPGRRTFLELAKRADVVVENFAP